MTTTVWKLTCELCAAYQRGEREDKEVNGARVHQCELIPRGLLAVECPCGCKLAQHAEPAA